MSKFGPQKGYLEVIHSPVTSQKPFDLLELRRAAEAAEFQNIGWPIGVVLQREEYSPKPMRDGILTKIVSDLHDSLDYWFLRNDGAYYFARTFVEDSATYRRERLKGDDIMVLAFDTRTRRVAEAFLHATRLYEALGTEGNTPIIFRISHRGLKDRVMTATDTRRSRTLNFRRTIQENELSWEREVPLSNITPNLKDLTFEVISNLFVLFGFVEFRRDTIDGIVDDFLTG